MNEPEYVGRRAPGRLYLCGRCMRGAYVFLGAGDSTVYEPSPNRPHGWCYVCGARDGLTYPYMLGVRSGDGGAELQTDLSKVPVQEGL